MSVGPVGGGGLLPDFYAWGRTIKEGASAILLSDDVAVDHSAVARPAFEAPLHMPQMGDLAPLDRPPAKVYGQPDFVRKVHEITDLKSKEIARSFVYETLFGNKAVDGCSLGALSDREFFEGKVREGDLKNHEGFSTDGLWNNVKAKLAWAIYAVVHPLVEWRAGKMRDKLIEMADKSSKEGLGQLVGSLLKQTGEHARDYWSVAVNDYANIRGEPSQTFTDFYEATRGERLEEQQKSLRQVCSDAENWGIDIVVPWGLRWAAKLYFYMTEPLYNYVNSEEHQQDYRYLIHHEVGPLLAALRERHSQPSPKLDITRVDPLFVDASLHTIVANALPAIMRMAVIEDYARDNEGLRDALTANRSWRRAGKKTKFLAINKIRDLTLKADLDKAWTAQMVFEGLAGEELYHYFTTGLLNIEQELRHDKVAKSKPTGAERKAAENAFNTELKGLVDGLIRDALTPSEKPTPTTVAQISDHTEAFVKMTTDYQVIAQREMEVLRRFVAKDNFREQIIPDLQARINEDGICGGLREDLAKAIKAGAHLRGTTYLKRMEEMLANVDRYLKEERVSTISFLRHNLEGLTLDQAEVILAELKGIPESACINGQKEALASLTEICQEVFNQLEADHKHPSYKALLKNSKENLVRFGGGNEVVELLQSHRKNAIVQACRWLQENKLEGYIAGYRLRLAEVCHTLDDGTRDSRLRQWERALAHMDLPQVEQAVNSASHLTKTFHTFKEQTSQAITGVRAQLAGARRRLEQCSQLDDAMAYLEGLQRHLAEHGELASRQCEKLKADADARIKELKAKPNGTYRASDLHFYTAHKELADGAIAFAAVRQETATALKAREALRGKVAEMRLADTNLGHYDKALAALQALTGALGELVEVKEGDLARIQGLALEGRLASRKIPGGTNSLLNELISPLHEITQEKLAEVAAANSSRLPTSWHSAPLEVATLNLQRTLTSGQVHLRREVQQLVSELNSAIGRHLSIINRVDGEIRGLKGDGDHYSEDEAAVIRTPIRGAAKKGLPRPDQVRANSVGAAITTAALQGITKQRKTGYSTTANDWVRVEIDKLQEAFAGKPTRIQLETLIARYKQLQRHFHGAYKDTLVRYSDLIRRALDTYRRLPHLNGAVEEIEGGFEDWPSLEPNSQVSPIRTFATTTRALVQEVTVALEKADPLQAPSETLTASLLKYHEAQLALHYYLRQEPPNRAPTYSCYVLDAARDLSSLSHLLQEQRVHHMGDEKRATMVEAYAAKRARGDYITGEEDRAFATARKEIFAELSRRLADGQNPYFLLHRSEILSIELVETLDGQGQTAAILKHSCELWKRPEPIERPRAEFHAAFQNVALTDGAIEGLRETRALLSQIHFKKPFGSDQAPPLLLQLEAAIESFASEIPEEDQIEHIAPLGTLNLKLQLWIDSLHEDMRLNSLRILTKELVGDAEELRRWTQVGTRLPDPVEPSWGAAAKQQRNLLLQKGLQIPAEELAKGAKNGLVNIPHNGIHMREFTRMALETFLTMAK